MYVVNVEQGWRQDATLWNPHLLLMQLQRSGTHSNLKGTLTHKKVDKPGEGAQLCCDWQCTEYDCTLLCSTVVLIEVSSFKVCRVLCKDVIDRVVYVSYFEGTVVLYFARTFSSKCSVQKPLFTEAIFACEFLLCRHYTCGVQVGQLDLLRSMFCDL